jgi:glycosyltransferase involved in cell wall biosynthesis
VTATVSAQSNTSGDLGVVLVTTAGRGSLDRYGQRLAEHLEVPTLELSLDRASARHFSVPFLSADVLRELGGDAHIIRELYRQPGLLHLAHHHFGRYVCFLPRRYVLTVHDLIRYFDATGQEISITRPTARDRLYIHLDCAGMRRAEALITPSEATRADLVRHLGVAPEKIFVVHDGLDHALFWPVERRIVEPPYVLFVGSEHPRKNVAILLRAFAGLKRDPRFSSLRLVKVGKAGMGEAPFREATLTVVCELGLHDDVVFTEYVPDDDLPAYYSGAACLVLPSRQEGFGFPPLEAMACGCPVVVSAGGALSEICGEAALTVPPDDVGGLEVALRTVLTDEATASRLRTSGLRHARRFNWERTGRETTEVYRVVQERFRGVRGRRVQGEPA